MTKPVTLYLDGMCLLHRAASGFTAGDHFIAFNFFRGLCSLVKRLSPTRIVMALEGSHSHRDAIDPRYKSNRRAPTRADFFSQVDETVRLLSESFPVSVVRHPELEADDVIARMVSLSSTAVKSVIVSTDRDYLQLVSDIGDSVELFDPVQKCAVELPPGVGSFLIWRALRGDASDCIPRIMPDAEAAACSADSGLLLAELSERGIVDRFEKNVALLRFASPRDGEDGWIRLQSSAPKRDWDAVTLQFSMWDFKSMISDMSKFIAPFEALWASR